MSRRIISGLRLRALIVMSALSATRTIAAQSPCPADLVIRNGSVLDGSGAPAVRADVAITGGRITAVSTTPLAQRCGAREVNARGLTVTPGFVPKTVIRSLKPPPLGTSIGASFLPAYLSDTYFMKRRTRT